MKIFLLKCVVDAIGHLTFHRTQISLIDSEKYFLKCSSVIQK